jgi:hypothetical protein
MRKPRAAVALSMALVAAPLLAESCHADSPLRPPTRQTIWSANRRFFAVMDPDQQITTVYRATNERQGERVWSMFGWFRVAGLADDGEHLVAGYDGMNLLPINYNKQQVMLYFFKRGELINHVTLDQLVLDNSKLRRTASHYYWGNYHGIDRAGSYVVDTVEGRMLRFDVTTGKPAAEHP